MNVLSENDEICVLGWLKSLQNYTVKMYIQVGHVKRWRKS